MSRARPIVPRGSVLVATLVMFAGVCVIGAAVSLDSEQIAATTYVEPMMLFGTGLSVAGSGWCVRKARRAVRANPQVENVAVQQSSAIKVSSTQV